MLISYLYRILTKNEGKLFLQLFFIKIGKAIQRHPHTLVHIAEFSCFGSLTSSISLKCLFKAYFDLLKKLDN